MNKRIVVDPITRIEGHLRIEAELAEAWGDQATPIPPAPWCAASNSS